MNKITPLFVEEEGRRVELHSLDPASFCSKCYLRGFAAGEKYGYRDGKATKAVLPWALVLLQTAVICGAFLYWRFRL